ncbi:uncharacterized protein METZ01_LOCUS136847 [marine metagenome]|uniref:Uncharacterized protein n=1 Tax=marine metagenome TaxID=408172 RepID=A0A381Z5B7_9ZZZZ
MCANNKRVSLPILGRLLILKFGKVLWTILPAVSKLTGSAKAVKISSKDPTLSSFGHTPGVSKGDAENNLYPVRFCVSLRSG